MLPSMRTAFRALIATALVLGVADTARAEGPSDFEMCVAYLHAVVYNEDFSLRIQVLPDMGVVEIWNGKFGVEEAEEGTCAGFELPVLLEAAEPLAKVAGQTGTTAAGIVVDGAAPYVGFVVDLVCFYGVVNAGCA